MDRAFGAVMSVSAASLAALTATYVAVKHNKIG